MPKIADRVWLAAGYALLALACLRSVENPDLFWHLSAGESLLRTGSVPSRDFLSWTMDGAWWTDFEWLSQLVYALVFRAGSFPALVLLKAALLLGAGAFLSATLRREGLGAPGRAAALALLAAGLGPVNEVRPENFSVLLFAAEIWGLEWIRRSELDAYIRKERIPMKAATAGWAIGMAVAWTNLHAAFAQGLVLLAIYALGAAAERDGRAARRFGGLLLLAAAATILNPFGLGIYGVLAEHFRRSAELGRHIREWYPASLGNCYHRPFWFLLAASAAVLGAAAAGRGDRAIRRGSAASESLGAADPRPRPPAAHLIATLSLAAATLRHVRVVPFFVLAALAFAGSACAGLRSRLPRAAAGAACAAAFALALAFFRTCAPLGAPRESWRRSRFPEAAATWLEREAPALAGLRLYNPWGWGGFLGWRLSPRYKVFVDGRYLFHDILAEEMPATADPRAWADFLDRRRVDLVLVERRNPPIPVPRRSGPEERPYYLFFFPQEVWALVYWDELALAFVRRSPAGRVPSPLPAWLDRRAYRYLHPDDQAALRRAWEAGRLPRAGLRAEACRHLAESGDDHQALDLLALSGGGDCE